MVIRKKFYFYIIYIIILIAAVEGSLRVFYAIKIGNYNTIVYPLAVIENVYPNLFDAYYDEVTIGNNQLDILILGGSVLTEGFSNVISDLEKSLANAYACKINVDNLAMPGHTSLDSRNKYALLKDNQYDVIIIYHGINELRFNNSPPSVFKKDYSHLAFYNVINMDILHWSKYSVMPYTFQKIKVAIDQLIFKNSYLSFNKVRQGWLQFGNEIKTAPSFRNNFKCIFDQVSQSQSHLIFSDFTYYNSKDITADSLKIVDTPYESKWTPLGIWGKKEHLIAGMEEHNEILGQLAAEYHTDQFSYLAINQSMPKNNEYFIDICHPTEKGASIFAALLFPEVAKVILDKNLCLDK